MERVTVRLSNNLEFNAIISNRGFNADIRQSGNFKFSGKNRRRTITLQFEENIPTIEDLTDIQINIIKDGININTFAPNSVDIDDNNKNIMTFIY